MEPGGDRVPPARASCCTSGRPARNLNCRWLRAIHGDGATSWTSRGTAAVVRKSRGRTEFPVCLWVFLCFFFPPILRNGERGVGTGAQPSGAGSGVPGLSRADTAARPLDEDDPNTAWWGGHGRLPAPFSFSCGWLRQGPWGLHLQAPRSISSPGCCRETRPPPEEKKSPGGAASWMGTNRVNMPNER